MSPPDPLAALRQHPLAGRLRRAAGKRPVHLVGGVLRDALLGLPAHDFDLVVAGGGDAFAAELARELPARLVRLGGERFAAYRLVARRYQVDLWDRGAADLGADLARRDFTVNSLALDLASGEVTDPHGGREDAARRRLRATTSDSLASDPLRILRLARLAGPPWRLVPDEPTLALARQALPGLDGVAPERVREELVAILGAAEALPAVELLGRLGLVAPLLAAARTVPPAAAAEAAARGIGRLEGLLAARDERLPEPASPAARAAARFATLARALEAVGAGDAADTVRRAQRRGRLSQRQAAAATRLLTVPPPPVDDRARRRFLHEAGELWGLALCVAAVAADTPGGAAREELARLASLARREGEAIFRPRPLLDGHEIQELLGLGPGPELGRLVALLRRAQIEGTVATRSDAVELLRRAAGKA